MGEKSRLGLCVLGAGLLLGVLGDALLRATPWGLNVTLWVGALVASAFVLRRRSRQEGEGVWALLCALGFACAFVWRDSLTLRALDVCAILALLSVALLGGRGGRVRRAGVTDYLLAGLASGLSALFGPLLLLFTDISWKGMPREGWSRHLFAVLRGLLIGVPLVFVFGALFVAADAVYEGIVRDTFNLDSELAVSHLLLFSFLAWLSAGYLRGLLLGREVAATGDERRAFVLLGFGGTMPSRMAGVASAGSSVAGSADTRVGRGAGPDRLLSLNMAKQGEGRRSNTGRDTAKGAADDAGGYRPQPPSVTEVQEEHGRMPPPSVVGAPPLDAEFETNSVSEEPKTIAVGEACARQGAGRQAEAAQPIPAAIKMGGPSLGIVEIGVVLGLLNALFFSFVAVQLRYFFGGAEIVTSVAGMTYSEYARRGFFELVWVAVLVLPLLLAAHWLLRKEKAVHERLFRVLAAGLLAMLFVVMASALGRMRLYQSEYGQTELRFYTTAFMGWLAIVFVWFALTVLRGARERFACGALVAALVVLGLLHVVNPNALIVRANVAHARASYAFDATYAASLGADAVPALLEASPNLSPAARAEVARQLLRLTSEEQGADWRSWNLARARARRAIIGSEALLREWARLSSVTNGASAAQWQAPSNDSPL
jgi:hypothetical protein